MASWSRFNTPPSAKEIANFLSQVDNGISTVKMVASLAKTNLEFAEMLMVGFINPMCIAVNFLADSIEGFVNDIFQTGIYHIIIDPTNVPPGVEPFIGGDQYQYPGSLLQTGLAVSYSSVIGLIGAENATANKISSDGGSAGSNEVDNQATRGEKQKATEQRFKDDLIRVYEARADLFIKQRVSTGYYTGLSQEQLKKERIIAMVLDVSKTGGLLTHTIMQVIETKAEYGDLGKQIVKDYYRNTLSQDGASSSRILGEPAAAIGTTGVEGAGGTDDNIFRTSRNFIKDYERKVFGYVASKAAVTGIVRMKPAQCFNALGNALFDEGDMNRPGSPHFARHLSLDANARTETRLEDPKKYFSLQKKSRIFDALIANAGSLPDSPTRTQKVASLRAQLSTVNSELGNLKEETVYAPYGAVMRDKFGRPKLLGYTDQVDMKKKGYFFQADYARSKDASMRSGTEQYHAMILYAGAPRISEIPTEFLDYMGLVFGASIKDYAQDIAGKIADIWTLDNQPRKILITESTKVSSQMVTVPSGYNPAMPLPGRMPQRKIVKEEQYKFQKGDILYGQNSKNTFIVLQNLGMTECNKIDFDDQGNVINAFKEVQNNQRKNEQEATNSQGGVTQFSAGGQPQQFQVDPTEPIPYTDQTLLIVPYNNDQEKGQFEPQDKEAFKKGELLYLAQEGDDGSIAPNRNVGGADNSFVVGKYVIELTEPDPSAYRIPNSTPPDFGPKYTVADLFPEQAGVLRATILGFCDMLRGFAKNSSSTLGVLIDMLQQLIDFITEIEKSFLEFLNWIKTLVKLADMNIYTTTVSASGIDNFARELNSLSTRPGAPPNTLEYSTCLMFLGTSADMAGFKSMLESSEAFANFEKAIQDTRSSIDKVLKGFEEDAKDAIKNTLARSDQFVKTLGEGRDDLFNTLNNPMSIANQIEDLTNVFTSDAAKRLGITQEGEGGDGRFGGDTSRSNISDLDNPRFQVGSRGIGDFVLDDFESAGLDGIDLEAARLKAGYRRDAANGIVDSRFLGLDDDEFLAMATKKEFYWVVKVARETAQIENNQGIIRYKLWWGKEIESAVGIQTEAVSTGGRTIQIGEDGTLVTSSGEELVTSTGFTPAVYEKIEKIHTFDITTGIDTDVELEVEVNVGANFKPTDATHLLLFSYGQVTKTLGGLEYIFEAENENPYAMEIMSLRPDMPEIAVDENISSVSISENKIINLDVTITDTDENGEGGTSTTLGYSVFLADINRKTFSEPIATLVRTGTTNQLVLTDVEVDPTLNPGWYYLAILAENQNGFSGGNMFNLSRISAPLDFAKEITYTDTNVVAGSLSGIVEVEPGQHTSQNGIDPYYKLFFGTYNQTKNTIATTGTQLYQDVNFRLLNANGNLEFSLANEAIPSGVTHFVVYSSIKKFANSSQEIYHTTPVFKPINDLGSAPNYSPVSLAFTDEDKVTGQVSGTFTIGPALDEQLVDNYQIFFADVDGVPIDTAGNQGVNNATPIHDDAIAELTPTVTGVQVPQGAVYFQACSKNAYGTGPFFARIPIVDPKYPTEPGEISNITKNNVRLTTNF